MSKFDFDGEDDMGKPIPGAEPKEPTWTCDTCLKPVLPNTPVYGLVADKETRTTRHWDCHQAKRQILREDMTQAQEDCENLAKALGRIFR